LSHDIYQAIFKAASVLEIPVVILALLSLAVVIFELGAFAIELFNRRRRKFARLSTVSEDARRDIDKGDRSAAALAVSGLARGKAMGRSLLAFVEVAGEPGADTRMAKELADFDFNRQRRLGRTRLLVRTGPALGLMGTLIPLSPALDGLARGNVTALTDNLRVAFSITVLGLLVGAIAFGLSLNRDRMYGQDLSDLEYVAAILSAPSSEVPIAVVPTVSVSKAEPKAEPKADGAASATPPVKATEPGR
jgi:biopolymer transport protein ExbB/TolQ